jgi:hypothetical protein
MREFMKVFVPMSDATLGANGEVCQQLVPFDPSFLNEANSCREGHKPSNWVSDSDYEQARERLFSARA